jgi:hypothetical protein
LVSDPCAEDGCLWFFNFFIYNKKMKRIVFISCRCTSKSVDSSYDDDEEMNDDTVEDDHRYYSNRNEKSAVTKIHQNNAPINTVVG